MEEKFTRKITQDDFVTEKNDIIKNNLLGIYDENNEYHISSQIVEELIALEKLKKSSFGNSVFCVGNLLGYGEIVFEVVYNNKSDNDNAQAFLFVLENVDKINGYLQNTIRTQIAHFSSDMGNFVAESYKKFNIIGTLGDEGREKKSLDEMSLDDSYILAKKAYSLLLDKLVDEKVLDAYGKYFTARLAALTKFDNPYTNEVLSKFNEQYTLIHGVFLQQKNYKTLNELLDKCLEETSGINPDFTQFESEFNQAIKPELDKFISSVESINEKSEDKAIDMLEKNDRDKMKEILSSQDGFEKDLSEGEFIDQSLVAPKQSLETLANEIDSLTVSEEDFSTILDTAGESVKSIDTEEMQDTADEEIAEEQSIVDEIEETPEITESIEETPEADLSDITQLFESSEGENQESDESEMGSEETPEGLFDSLKEYVQDSPVQESPVEEVEETEELEDAEEDEYIDETEELDEEINKILAEKENKEKIVVQPENPSTETIEPVEESSPIDDLFAESEVGSEEVVVEDDMESTETITDKEKTFKENGSMSIYDRLNRLNKNINQSSKTYEKPKVSGDSGKLGKLYDLLDRSMDR